MTTSAEHRVAMHRLSTERRYQVKTLWASTITCVRAASDHYADDGSEIRELVDELADVADSAVFAADSDRARLA